MKLRSNEIVYTNNYIDIVMKACKECYAGKTDLDLAGKLKYIQGKVKLGHESVLEHSNIVINFDVLEDEILDYIQVLDNIKYLNTKTHIVEDKKNNVKTLDVLFGGSISGYKELIREIPSGNNKILSLIINKLYELPKEFFYDFIEAGVMNESRFKSIIEEPESLPVTVNSDVWEFEIPNMDDINRLYAILEGRFSYDELLDMVTCTVHFTHMSRIITQQVTRHRNAISQKSQRYVLENDCVLLNPMFFKPEKYEGMEIEINGKTYTCADKFIAGVGDKLYNELLQLGLHREDARSFLLNATESSLYMTFTFRRLIHFLDVRTDSHAQAEIRYHANHLYKEFMDVNERYLGEPFKYLIPKYMFSEVDYEIDNSIDEIIDEIIEGIKE